MLTSPRPAGEEPGPMTPAGLLAAAGPLLRTSGQGATAAGVILTLVAFGVIGRFTTGPAVHPLGLVVFAAMCGSFVTAGALAVRARLTLLRALGEIRVRIGAPLDPGVPWTPAGSYGRLREEVFHRELQRLIGAAYRGHDLSLHALLWALATALLFLVWLLT